MSPAWPLGGRRFTPLRELARLGEGCAWHLVQGEGRDWLLERRCPRPPARELDRLREQHLQRFLAPEPWDPPESRFGVDETQAWLLQALPGRPLGALWAEWTEPLRTTFRARLAACLATSGAPRLLEPEALRVLPGRLLLPRTLGEAPHGRLDLEALLGAAPPGTAAEALFTQAPPLGETWPMPLRGRTQELTYLKSLALGLTARVPMERVIVISGEEGQDQEPLAAWTAAAAETEGLWVQRLALAPEESAGTFLARLLQGLLQGVEADLYARHPEAARTLARHLEAFAFLRSARRLGEPGGPDAEERLAALQALDFAAERHPTLVLVSGLERAQGELQHLLAELVRRSRLPWLLVAAPTATKAHPRALFGALKGCSDTAFVALNRLEDATLRERAGDLLGPHALPAAYLEEACRESLGNPGLLQRVLELAQLREELRHERGAWSLAPGVASPPRVREDLATGILGGRLRRLGSASLAGLRLLALADRSLDLGVLGRALGLAGEPLEEALHPAAAAQLLFLEDERATLADPRIRSLALAGLPPGEAKRLARSLLKALDEAAGHPVPAVRLRALASDPATALAQVLEATEQGLLPPAEAGRVVEEALALAPSRAQQARLWEYLSDAWASSPAGGNRALEALAQAEAVLGHGAPPDGQARLLRKRAFLELGLRRLGPAFASVQAAAAVLADQPRHPEQVRLHLALGRIHLLEGHPAKGMAALEEGLELIQEAERRDQGLLLLELGRAQSRHGQLQRGLATLQGAQRLLEAEGDEGGLARAILATAATLAALGLPARARYREALAAARRARDPELVADCHLEAGAFLSLGQELGEALGHLGEALSRFQGLGLAIPAARARVWLARSLAALGAFVQADMELLQALSLPPECLSAEERGEHAFLQGEIAVFRDAWADGARLFARAARLFGPAGLLGQERLALLHGLQAEARATPGSLEGPWSRLEALKAPVEGSGSRRLELEWHRAHALLLEATRRDGSLGVQALQAWGGALAAARDLQLPACVLEAEAACARILLEQGERLGAASRLQEALDAFHQLWDRVPEAHGEAFLARPDLHRFRLGLEAAGLHFGVPPRREALPDWTPTQASPTVDPSDRGAR